MMIVIMDNSLAAHTELNVSLNLKTAAGMYCCIVTSGKSKSEETGNFALNIKETGQDEGKA